MDRGADRKLFQTNFPGPGNIVLKYENATTNIAGVISKTNSDGGGDGPGWTGVTLYAPDNFVAGA